MNEMAGAEDKSNIVQRKTIGKEAAGPPGFRFLAHESSQFI
jgi:hypothetical protein